MSLIKTTIDMPLIRKGEAFGPWIFEASNADGSAPFAAGTTYTIKCKASTSSAILATGTVSRVSDTQISISLTQSNVDTICDGVIFSLSDGVSLGKAILEISRTSGAPATLAIIYADVVQ